MRIIAGKFRGRRIKAPPVHDTRTRPTLDRVRETLFNILGGTFDPIEVADLCAGTGALGIEALSRGAAHATFFESYGPNKKLINENLSSLELESQATVIGGPLPKSLLKLDRAFDLILFDPPWDSDLPEQVLPVLIERKFLRPNSLIVVEQDKRRDSLAPPASLIIKDERVIGDTKLWFLKMKNQ